VVHTDTQCYSKADHSLTEVQTGLVLFGPSQWNYRKTSNVRHDSPYFPESFLWYSNASRLGARLPIDVEFLRHYNISSVFSQRLRTSATFPPIFDDLGGLQHLLTRKSALLNPTRTESTKDELDLLFGDGNQPAIVKNVLPWLLAVSSWGRHIELLDRRLERLRNVAMSSPSLATFKPIPLLRQHITEIQHALREIKDGISEEENQAFLQLQQVAQFRLETLDGMFNTLLKQASALSSKASNWLSVP
jgi:hypothetical protein